MRDLDLVIEARAGKNFETRAGGPTFGIVGTINETGDAGLDYGTSTHATGFYGDVECRAGHAVIADKACCFTNSDNFGVRRGVAVTNRTVARTGENLTVMHDECANGNFASDRGFARFLDGELHE